jgi:hypothetical protein
VNDAPLFTGNFGSFAMFSSARTTPSVANLPCPHIHVRSLGRFDEITDLVEKTPGLALQDFPQDSPVAESDLT